MTPEVANRLHDARHACLEIASFIEGKSIDAMWQDRRLQLSLHKLIEIVGEALNQARKIEPEIANQVPNLHRFVAVRNQITHGYKGVDYAIVWAIAVDRMPPLVAALDEALAGFEADETQTY